MKITVKILIVVLVLGIVTFLAFFLLKRGSETRVSISEPLSSLETTTTESEVESKPLVPDEVKEEPAAPEKREPAPPPIEPEPELPPPPRKPQEFIITIYSNERAEPANLTIHIGDTVTMINAGNDLHWPGADPHPTHSSLPPFDALGGLSKRQSFSYTFRKTGIYGYHEHLLDDPPTIGFITVLP